MKDLSEIENSPRTADGGHGSPELIARDKLKQMALYFIRQDMVDNDSSEKIAIMCYLSDVNYYVLYGESITGATYVRRDFGPAPRDWEAVLEEMVDEGLISKTLRSST